MSSHTFAVNGEIFFSSDADQNRLKEAILELLEYIDFDCDQGDYIDRAQAGVGHVSLAMKDEKIESILFHLNEEYSESDFPNMLRDFASAVSPFIEGADYLLVQDLDSGDYENNTWKVWFGEGEALEQTMKLDCWQEMRQSLLENGFSSDQVNAAAQALDMPVGDAPRERMKGG